MMNPDKTRLPPMDPAKSGRRLRWLASDSFWMILFSIGLGILIFREYLLFTEPVRMTMDDSVGAVSLVRRMIPGGYAGAWNDAKWLGGEEVILPGWTTFWLWVLPPGAFVNHIYPLSLVMGSIFLGLFLRRRGCRLPAVALGILTAFWLGNNLTLCLPGHMGKFGLMMVCALFLWLTDKAAERGSWPWLVLAGGAMGVMPLEQRDQALFAWMILAPYAVYALWRDASRPSIAYLVGRMAILLTMALIMSLHVAVAGYREILRPGATTGFDSAGEKYAFATQWSWPPEESIDFIAPGYMGWRTRDPTGPYWGRMGQSPEWQALGIGHRNFKHESAYIGLIPLVFAWLALVAALLSRRSREPRPLFDRAHPTSRMRIDIYFWSAAATLSLLLAFGKYFPLYSVIHRLPVISAIRNPNKFLQLFQLALGVLAAYGFTLALGGSQVTSAGIRSRIASLRRPAGTDPEEG